MFVFPLPSHSQSHLKHRKFLKNAGIFVLMFVLTVLRPIGNSNAYYSTNAAADVVIGQPDFTSTDSNQGGAADANTMIYPQGIHSDGTRLFVADSQNNRVLIYNNIPTTNNAAADVVIGQPDFTSTDSNQGGAAGANTLNEPVNIYSDGTRLFVTDLSNNRVLIYNNIPTTNNAAADVVIGQPDFTSTDSNQGGVAGANTLNLPYALFSDGTRLFVSDINNNRVLIYNTIPTTNNASADVVIGQLDFTSTDSNQGGAAAANTLSDPQSLSSDGTKLFVADGGNGRVLIYNTIPTTNNASADVVIGQPDFTSDDSNQGGSAAANTLSIPRSLSYDGVRLFVADGMNNRVLIYNTIPTTNNASADVVIGQPDFSSNIENQGGSAAANTFFDPQSISSNGTKLFVADTINNRVLVFTNTPDPTPSPTPSPSVSPSISPIPSPSPSPNPSPIPTLSPSLIPTPQPSSGGSSALSSTPNEAKPPTCADAVPVGETDFFQINRARDAAKLYFTPVNDNVEKYHVVYGFKQGDERFGSLSNPVTKESNNGVQSLTISHLNSTSEYWFKVAPVNGCAVGTWSEWMKAEKWKNKTGIFYKYTR